MSDGPESELELALDRVRSLPPIADPRDAVVEAAVAMERARQEWEESEWHDEETAFVAWAWAGDRFRAAVAAYRAGEGR